MIFKRLGTKWNNPPRSNLQSNHLPPLPWVQSTGLTALPFLPEREVGRQDLSVGAGSRAGLSWCPHLRSRPSWGIQAWERLTLQIPSGLLGLWGNSGSFDSTSMAAEGKEPNEPNGKALVILLRPVISPPKGALSSCFSWFELQPLNETSSIRKHF